MPTGKEYSQALRDIVDFTEAIGNSIEDEYDFDTDDGYNGNGYVCNHGGNIYYVTGSDNPDTEYFKVEFRYDLLGEYAQLQALENGVAIEDLSDEDVDREASRADLDERAEENPDQYADLVSNLRGIISSPSATAYAVSRSENGAVLGFNIEHLIFIYEDDFGASDYHRAVQKCISTGLPGRIFLQDAFGILEGIEPESDTSESTDDDSVSETPRYLS